ncbi:cbb3-type cytochrome oxidase assembly protein CcoS [Henriciella sp. AS95]|uniref:cbb3-type cytochrome oxidase assembly protein CcoS n=1 Tax=Henriciella sp. AS95 TaxID=3135782 RepID=UPI00316D3CD8
MEMLAFLIPIALFLGLIGLVAFIWAAKTGQFDDPEGDAARILIDDDHPLP